MDAEKMIETGEKISDAGKKMEQTGKSITGCVFGVFVLILLGACLFSSFFSSCGSDDAERPAAETTSTVETDSREKELRSCRRRRRPHRNSAGEALGEIGTSIASGTLDAEYLDERVWYIEGDREVVEFLTPPAGLEGAHEKVVTALRGMEDGAREIVEAAKAGDAARAEAAAELMERESLPLLQEGAHEILEAR